MRRLLLIVLLLAASPALAAPTCLDMQGRASRCGQPSAMPVGWQPSPQLRAQWDAAQPPGPDAGEIVQVMIVLAAFFAMIALMPEFDGSKAEDWEP